MLSEANQFALHLKTIYTRLSLLFEMANGLARCLPRQRA
jgi:hypothetical protein